ncbi:MULTISPECIES: YopX family protein [Helicobacter]|uniref:YopX family protein n=1 Tax=Helicobacter TaxID=209 RepID=UPI0026258ADE|nr:YopX family protein [Helicobacter sp. UBA3407]
MKVCEVGFRVYDKEAKEYNRDKEVLLSSNGNIYRIHTITGELQQLKPELLEVEFYTGFKDENGCKIYEGDILDTGDFRDVVKFEKSKGWILQETLDSLDDYQDLQLEVIGNIHENPELLGGEK